MKNLVSDDRMSDFYGYLSKLIRKDYGCRCALYVNDHLYAPHQALARLILDKTQQLTVKMRIIRRTIPATESFGLGALYSLRLSLSDGDLLIYRPTCFNRHEFSEISLLRRHVVWSLQQMRIRQQMQDYIFTLDIFVQGLPTPLLVLNWNLKIMQYNDAARQRLNAIINGHSYHKPDLITLPSELCHHLETFKRNLIAQTDYTKQLELLSNYPHVKYRITFYKSSSKGGDPGIFLVTILDNEIPAPLESGALSLAEQAVFNCAREGLGAKEIAHHLGKSRGTIKKQIHSVYKKLKVQDRIDLLKKFG